ncbi:hypothetical protein [Priestia megaterium]|uniref:Uncharacterized protein n=1 Tax=Priestia megaterium TaxID=1404 RepID=A0A6M6E085_PRIMG|nr:hypothetical protein [Priestia megaterium]QJX80402.1 hypothetical protein FDZ14_30410 [Priestia megaterium]
MSVVTIEKETEKSFYDLLLEQYHNAVSSKIERDNNSDFVVTQNINALEMAGAYLIAFEERALEMFEEMSTSAGCDDSNEIRKLLTKAISKAEAC